MLNDWQNSVISPNDYMWGKRVMIFIFCRTFPSRQKTYIKFTGKLLLM